MFALDQFKPTWLRAGDGHDITVVLVDEDDEDDPNYFKLLDENGEKYLKCFS